MIVREWSRRSRDPLAGVTAKAVFREISISITAVHSALQRELRLAGSVGSRRVCKILTSAADVFWHCRMHRRLQLTFQGMVAVNFPCLRELRTKANNIHYVQDSLIHTHGSMCTCIYI